MPHCTHALRSTYNRSKNSTRAPLSGGDVFLAVCVVLCWSWHLLDTRWQWKILQTALSRAPFMGKMGTNGGVNLATLYILLCPGFPAVIGHSWRRYISDVQDTLPVPMQPFMTLTERNEHPTSPQDSCEQHLEKGNSGILSTPGHTEGFTEK